MAMAIAIAGIADSVCSGMLYEINTHTYVHYSFGYLDIKIPFIVYCCFFSSIEAKVRKKTTITHRVYLLAG